MKTLLKTFIIITLLVTNGNYLQAQPWMSQLMDKKSENGEEITFFDIQRAFYGYWEPFGVQNGYYYINGEKHKADGYNQFKRWEWFWQRRINPSTGAFPKTNAVEIRELLKGGSSSKTDYSNWISLGPNTTMGGYGGIGRINCIGFRPGDNNTFYVGSPSGGLWKTTDGGVNWQPLTDQNAVLGVSDVVVFAGATTSTDTLFIATGDRDMGTIDNLPTGHVADNHSIGVLKSVDGGATWTTTGLSFSTGQLQTTNRLLAVPGNHRILYAATSDGLYKTTNAGTDWTRISTEDFVDLEFNTANSSIIYASTRTGGDIWRSENSGGLWEQVLNVSGGYRTELAVTANDADRIYAVVTNNDRGLRGVWRSNNAGLSFDLVYEEATVGNGNQNLLNRNCLPGALIGGQGDYDLAIAADPLDAETVFVGGINTWKSIDGGNAFVIVNHWNSTCGGTVETVHADKHCLAFQNGTSTLFEGNDGGIYKTINGGINWTDLSNGLVISQFYQLSVSQTNPSEIIGGLQDNGSKSMISGIWTDVLGADGMDCAIDYTTGMVQYATMQNGVLYRTTNHWTDKTKIYEGDGAWVTPLVIDPVAHNTIYFTPGMNVVKSTDRGSHWSSIGSFAGDEHWSLDVAPSNPAYIYVAEKDVLRKTTNGGTDWTVVTGSLPVSSSYITGITICHDNSDKVWVSMGNYNSYCVFETTTGGSTWTDVSAGLPEVPVMKVIQNRQNTMSDELYVATDVGVFQKVGSTPWTSYNTNLPNVVVTDLDIYYMTGNPTQSRLRVSTFGRGIWESVLPPPPPVTDFSAGNTSPSIAETVVFTDLSTGTPTSWLWSFDPSTVTFMDGTSASSQNPHVRFDAINTYTVSLHAENEHGYDTETKTGYINATEIIYCSASGGSSLPGWEYIDRVEMGTIFNIDTGPDQYSDFTAQTTNVGISSNNDISITVQNCYPSDDLGVWIDWNKDGDFGDPGENVICISSLGFFGTYTYFGTITVPANATLTTTRMRIRLKYEEGDCGSPCGATTSGEVEDYGINVVAGTNDWTGIMSSDWSKENNWQKGTIPSDRYDVTIPASPMGGHFPEILSETNANCNNLTIESGAILNISGNLTVLGVLDNEAGTTGLVIKSNASGTGSLIESTGSVAASVERYIPAYEEDAGWHFLSSPVNSQPIRPEFVPDINPIPGSNDFYKFDEVTNLWINTRNASGNWNTAFEDNFVVGRAYLAACETSDVKTFTGTLNQGSLVLDDGSLPAITFTTGMGQGWNLIGNPYPSAIDWDNLTRSNVNGAVYVYDGEAGQYKSWNGTIGDLTDGIIPPMNGFFVKVSDDANINISNSSRIHSSISFYKEKQYISNLLVFEATGNGFSDVTFIRFNQDATDGFDNDFDGYKLSGSDAAPQLYTTAENINLSINELPFSTQEIIIPLCLEAIDGKEYEISLAENTLSESVFVMVNDLHTGTIQNLKINNKFSVIHNAGIPSDRFQIMINGATETEEMKLPDESISILFYDNTLNIKTRKPGKIQVSVCNLAGAMLFSRIYENTPDIQLKPELANGFYLVNVRSDDAIQTKKILIMK